MEMNNTARPPRQTLARLEKQHTASKSQQAAANAMFASASPLVPKQYFDDNSLLMLHESLCSRARSLCGVLVRKSSSIGMKPGHIFATLSSAQMAAPQADRFALMHHVAQLVFGTFLPSLSTTAAELALATLLNAEEQYRAGKNIYGAVVSQLCEPVMPQTCKRTAHILHPSLARLFESDIAAFRSSLQAMCKRLKLPEWSRPQSYISMDLDDALANAEAVFDLGDTLELASHTQRSRSHSNVSLASHVSNDQRHAHDARSLYSVATSVDWLSHSDAEEDGARARKRWDARTETAISDLAHSAIVFLLHAKAYDVTVTFDLPKRFASYDSARMDASATSLLALDSTGVIAPNYSRQERAAYRSLQPRRDPRLNQTQALPVVYEKPTTEPVRLASDRPPPLNMGDSSIWRTCAAYLAEKLSLGRPRGKRWSSKVKTRGAVPDVAVPDVGSELPGPVSSPHRNRAIGSVRSKAFSQSAHNLSTPTLASRPTVLFCFWPAVILERRGVVAVAQVWLTVADDMPPSPLPTPRSPLLGNI
ncbi:hypothetical protein RI367_008092 [Sorochytrium milnesiophthora]